MKYCAQVNNLLLEWQSSDFEFEVLANCELPVRGGELPHLGHIAK